MCTARTGTWIDAVASVAAMRITASRTGRTRMVVAPHQSSGEEPYGAAVF